MAAIDQQQGFTIGDDEDEQPVVTTPVPVVTPLVDPKVATLLELFPDSSADIISIVLEHSNGDLQSASDTLLAMNDTSYTAPDHTQLDADAAYARSLVDTERPHVNNPPLAYQPYTRRARTQPNSNTSDPRGYNPQGEREETRSRDELDQLSEGFSKLAEQGSKLAEQGKKTLGSFFSRVKEQINKLDEGGPTSNVNTMGGTGPSNSGWTPPSALPNPMRRRAASPASDHAPDARILSRVDESSLPKIPSDSALPPLPTETVQKSVRLATPPPSEPRVSTPEGPKKDFSKIGLLPRQSVSLLDQSASKGGAHESDDEEYTRSPFDDEDS